MPARVVLFDFGGTLDSDGLTWLERFHAVYRDFGIAPPRDDFTRAFYESDDNLPARHRLSGLGLEETLVLQVQDVLAALAPDRLGEARAIAGRFLAGSRKHFLRARPVLDRLRRRFSLGIVSNFYGNLDAVLESEGLLGCFAAVADSGAVGRLKPDPALLRHALRALGAAPEDAWMVGDSIERDMRGAERLGMRHAWLRGPRPDAGACCPRAAVLRSLADIEDRLDAAEVGA